MSNQVVRYCNQCALKVWINRLKQCGVELKNKIQLEATYYFIMLMLGSTCFGHHYAHHQELTTIALVTT